MVPIDILSLTANIVQVVDFAVQVSKQLKEQYRSADGMVEEHSESLKIVHDMRKQQTLLKMRLSSKAGHTEEEEDVLQISNLCDEVAKGLETELRALILPDDTTHRKTQVVRLTFRARRRKRAILEIQERLQRLQKLLDSRLISMVKGDSSYLMTKLDEVAQVDRSLQANTSMQLSSTKDQIIDIINAQSIDYGRIADLFIKFTKEEKEADKALQILKRLQYFEHMDRYYNVSEAHQSTFQWIFDDQKRGFSDWLQHQSGIYWISGKAGSGKSTMMKFIEEHDETIRLLESWAGDQKIIIASHYFWISGSNKQRSREGFLRSIIFQILRKHPVLIPNIFPQQWLDRDERELGNLSPKMLEAALCTIVAQIDRPKICLFIDGLDEYDCAQDEIVGLLKRFVDVPSVKLCVSSRPWEKFEHAFHDSPKCRVHELTEDDIRRFAQDTIAESQDLMALMGTEFEAMTEQIVQKSSGVFFWVFLVVRMLLSAPAEGANFRDLQKKIDSYPAELEALFDRIYKTIKREYHRDTAHILKMCLASYGAPTLAPFQLLDKDDTEYIFRNDFHHISRSEVDEWKNRLEKRINARCKDFLHIVETKLIEGAEVSVYQVEFLHRTVRDYLQNELMPKHFEKELGEKFDANLVLAQGALMVFKCVDLPRLLRSEEENTKRYLEVSLDSVLFPAQHYEEQWVRPLTRLIDEIDHLFSNSIHISAQDQHWSHSISRLYRRLEATDMVDVASLSSLDLYILEKLQSDRIQTKAKWNLLTMTLIRSMMAMSGMDYRILIDEILRHGADINGIVPSDGRTVWEIFFNELSHHLARQTTWNRPKSDIGDMIIMLLNSGADPHLVLHRQDEYIIKYDIPLNQHRPRGPRTIEDVVRTALPCQMSKILPVLEQKRRERAGLSSQNISNPGEESGPTPQATTDSPAPTLPQQNGLTKILSAWNPFNLWPTAPTHQPMLEDSTQEDVEASASQGISRVVTGA